MILSDQPQFQSEILDLVLIQGGCETQDRMYKVVA